MITPHSEALGTATPGEWIQLGVVDADDRLLGDVAVWLDDAGLLAMIGYTLAPESQGKGYAAEAVRALVEWLFTTRKVHRVAATIDPENVASARVLERNGFRYIGTARSAALVRGVWSDDARFEILADEWRAWKRRPGRPRRVELIEITSDIVRRVGELDRAFSQRKFVSSVYQSYGDALVPPSHEGTRITPWVKPLQDAGYAVVAFDQAAHGRSGGTHTTLPDFTCHLLAVGHHFGPAAAVIGHSLGGAATALALARGLDAQRAVLIAPAADPLAAVERFSRFVWLAGYLGRRMFARFEQAMRFDASELQAQANAPVIARPALIVHDVEDREVPWSEGERYARYWNDSRLLSTRGLGHNRIADDAGVIAAALRFLRGETVGDRVVSSPNLPYGVA